MATTSNTTPTWAWRPLLVLGGLCLIAGGAMHPQGPDSGSVAHRIGPMIVGHEGIWLVGHGLMTIGTALLLAGFIVARKADAWPGASRALALAIPATALSVIDLTLHTLDVVDGDELAAGTIPPLTWVHVVVAVVAGVLLGLALANLAWSLARSWRGPRMLLAPLGIVGGLAAVVATPIVLIFGVSTLFPVSCVATAFWAITTGIAGAPALEPTVRVGATAA